jgi:hypothetical protein
VSSWSKRIRDAAILRVQRARVQARARLTPHRVPGEASARDDIPIFLLGVHRSGTSLLRRIVDSHSRLACPAETLMLEHLAAAVGGRDARDGLSAVGMTPAELAAELRPIAERAFRRWATARGKRRWADKTPTVIHQLDGLDLLFGERAQYVALLRNGLDVAASLGAANPIWWQLEPYRAAATSHYTAAAAYWRDRTARLLDFADLHHDRVHVLKYEDLVRDPEGVLRPMFAFLGEPWEPGVLDFNRHPHDGGLEDHHVSTTTTIEDHTGKHRALPAAVQSELWAIVREVAVRAGYADRGPRS